MKSVLLEKSLACSPLPPPPCSGAKSWSHGSRTRGRDSGVLVSDWDPRCMSQLLGTVGARDSVSSVLAPPSAESDSPRASALQINVRCLQRGACIQWAGGGQKRETLALSSAHLEFRLCKKWLGQNDNCWCPAPPGKIWQPSALEIRGEVLCSRLYPFAYSYWAVILGWSGVGGGSVSWSRWHRLFPFLESFRNFSWINVSAFAAWPLDHW